MVLQKLTSLLVAYNIVCFYLLLLLLLFRLVLNEIIRSAYHRKPGDPDLDEDKDLFFCVPRCQRTYALSNLYIELRCDSLFERCFTLGIGL